MKKVTFLLFALPGSLLLLGNLDGAFPENTNAPGELTCGRAPCHNVPVNVGAAEMSIEFSGDAQQYFTDSTYLLTVKITNQPTMRNGFQILALDESNQNAGTWQLLEPDKMKIIPGIGLPNRKYVTHLAAGNLQTEWKVAWKAPATAVGKVSFYASVNATNNNGEKTGDQVYTSKIDVDSAMPNAVSDETSPLFKVYPTIAGEGVWVEVQAAVVSIDLTFFNNFGAVVSTKRGLSGGRHYLGLSGFPSGVYFLRMEADGKPEIEKLVVR